MVSLMLVLALLAGFALPVRAGRAEQGSQAKALSFEQTASSAAPQRLLPEATKPESQAPDYANTDLVRVSIVLDRASTIGAGYATSGIAANASAMSYRDSLKQEQAGMTASIERATGNRLDVVWNLTLAANLISANIPYGQLSAIQALPGVREVILENRYDPAVYSVDEPDSPNMSTSCDMIGSAAAWACGYTGAGSRIAVIDTGIDTNHQSFSDEAFAYSLSKRAELTGQDADTYVESLHLLDAEEITSLAGELNVPVQFQPEDLYINSKIPFGYNYIDRSLEVTHDKDSQGDHGSHVASIAAANAYIPQGDGSFSSALESVLMQGVAPDAQILTMKVFGARGGAYDSDYMAAIEDAIVLGCDSVNLSLGSGNPGFSHSDLYEEILDRLADCGTVVTVSAGNAGGWADQAVSGVPYLYSEDVSLDTVGSPGSYTNSLSVASVDNTGYTGMYLTAGEHNIFYDENTDYGNGPLKALAGEHSYILIDGAGSEADWMALAGQLEGKIAICSRGETSFYEKANAAAANGAIATIIYNNVPGALSMDLSGYRYDQPCVAITQEEGAILRASATAKTAPGGAAYYEGTLTVSQDVSSQQTSPEYYTMSSFSSYGIPGDLTMKPEITAPGGSIYGVQGMDPAGTSYQNMSGTSMASPQVAGMAALVAGHIRSNQLDEKTGVSSRHLIQSLLMSTAKPLQEEASGGNYWSILRQGAGLAHVGSAISAGSYIQMGENATASWADYKVKAELGDDPERTGRYTFDFSLHNFSDAPKHYTLTSDFFTQGLLEGSGVTYLNTQTVALPLEVTYQVDGTFFIPKSKLSCDLDGNGVTDAKDAQLILDYAAGLRDAIGEAADLDHDGAVTTYDAHLLLSTLETGEIVVEPGQAVTIQVSASIPQDVKEALDSSYENGAYLEGFVYVNPIATADGALEDVAHSIPVLGFYGSWSEASMFEPVSVSERMYGSDQVPYSGTYSNSLVVKFDGNTTPYFLTGNPYIIEDEIPTSRLAIRSVDTVHSYEYSLIRNAAALVVTVTDQDGELLSATSVQQQALGSFFQENRGAWANTVGAGSINRKVASLGLEEDETFTVEVIAVPEYYTGQNAMTLEDILALKSSGSLKEGSFLTTTLTVDDTAPVVESITKDLLTGNLTVTARDNQYIAAIQVSDLSGTKIYGNALPDATEKGQRTSTTIDLAGALIGETCLVMVADYADNVTVYELTYGGESEDYTGRMFGFTSGYFRGPANRWVELDPETIWYDFRDEVGEGMETVAAAGKSFTAAEYVNGRIFTAATDGCMYTTLHGQWANYQKVGRFAGITDAIADMALNVQNGKLYALDTHNTLYTVDMITGALTQVATLSAPPLDEWSSAPEFRTLAIDDEGNFYTINSGGSTTAFLYRFTLDDVSGGAVTGLSPVNPQTPCGVWSFATESMAWDHDRDLLYLASAYSTMYIDNKLYTIDTQTGLATPANPDYAGDYDENLDRNASQLYDQIVGLYIVPAGSQTDVPTDTAQAIELSAETLELLCGGTATLTADVYPWTLTDQTVTWSSSNEAVATVHDGTVTATGAGTATITATTRAKPNLSASCTITVDRVPDIRFSGLIYGADNIPVWAEFTSSNPGDYTIVGQGDRYVAGGFLDETIYVHDNLTMYAVDADTFAATHYGGIAETWAWSDAAPAPATKEGYFGRLVGICDGGKQVEFIKPDAGTLTSWNLSGGFSEDPMAVLAYAGSGTYDYDAYFEVYPNCPAVFYYMMTEGGELYRFIIFTADKGKNYNLTRQYLGSTGLDLTNVSQKDGSFGSLLYDEESGYLLLSAYTGGDTANLYAIDPQRFLVSKLGDFGPDVWPAVSLYQYDRATELTLRMEETTAEISVDDLLQLHAKVKPSSFTGGIVWSSSDDSIATVDSNGLVTALAAGVVEITATSVDTGSDGKPVSQTCTVTVLGLTPLQATVNAQIETEEGLSWVTIDLSNGSTTSNASASTKLTGAGYCGGFIYGTNGDYENPCHFYKVDPANGFAETMGPESAASYSMLDAASAPALQVTFGDHEVTAFDRPVFIAQGQRLSLLDFQEGTALGWGLEYYRMHDLAAIALVGQSTNAEGNTIYHYLALNTEGDLYQLGIRPSSYDPDRNWLDYSLSTGTLGNIGKTFSNLRTLSMTCIQNDSGLYGLVIADASSPTINLYFVDLKTEALSCRKICSLKDATHISGLYSDVDMLPPSLDGTQLTIRPGTDFTSSSQVSLDQEPVTNVEATILPGDAETTANPVTGWVHALTGRYQAPTQQASLDASPVSAAGGSVTLTLTEDTAATNGLFTVSYDPQVLTYAGLSSLIGSRAVHVDEEQGLVTFAYAAPSAIAAGQALAEVKFTYAAPHVASTLRLTTLQKNEDVTVSSPPVELSVRDGDCPSATFRDLDPNAWYHESIDFVLNAGLMNGMSATEFSPNGKLTRGQMVTILYRMAGSPAADKDAPFTDVKAGRYYTQAIRWAWAEGIANGITPTRFAPEEPITREQMVTFLARYAASTGKEIASQVDLSSFPDSELISEYAKKSMAWAVENGILNGMDGKLAPKATATRAQSAAVLQRYCASFGS